MSKMRDTKTCFVCDTPSTMDCEGCKTVSYCGAEHQTKDWDSHKTYCLRVKEATHTVDAILFAENETKPRIIKIPITVRLNATTNEPYYHKLDTEAWFPSARFSSVRPLYFGRFGVRGPELGYGMCFIYDEDFSQNGSPVNKCVREVTRGHSGIVWRGNVFALRLQKTKDGKDSFELFEDVVPTKDLAACVRNFEEHGAVLPIW